MTTYKQKHINISDLSTDLIDSEVLINGWIRNLRLQSNLSFVEVYDGTTSKTVQLITEQMSHFETLKTASVGSSKAVFVLCPSLCINVQTTFTDSIPFCSVLNETLKPYSDRIGCVIFTISSSGVYVVL